MHETPPIQACDLQCRPQHRQQHTATDALMSAIRLPLKNVMCIGGLSGVRAMAHDNIIEQMPSMTLVNLILISVSVRAERNAQTIWINVIVLQRQTHGRFATIPDAVQDFYHSRTGQTILLPKRVARASPKPQANHICVLEDLQAALSSNLQCNLRIAPCLIVLICPKNRRSCNADSRGWMARILRQDIRKANAECQNPFRPQSLPQVQCTSGASRYMGK